MLITLAFIGVISLILYYLLNRDLLNELVGNKIISKFKKKKNTDK